jgi:hypothetical protein
MCPVHLWVSGWPSSNAFEPTREQTTTVLLPNGQLAEIKASELLLKLHASVTAIGKDVLSFGPQDIGLHSLCSGAATAM